MNKSPVYLRDLRPSLQDDGFFGKQLNALKERAEKEESEIIVGYYLDKPILEDEE